MTVTLEFLAQHRHRLGREIAERQAFLAAVDTLHTYMARSGSPKEMELDSLLSAFSPSAAELLPEPLTDAPPPAELGPTPPYKHPELQALGANVPNTRVVRWAIGHMMEDYSLHDIKALLLRAGGGLGAPRISMVLSRLCGKGQIEEVRRGSGTTPALYRKSEAATPLESAAAETLGQGIIATAGPAFNG